MSDAQSSKTRRPATERASSNSVDHLVMDFGRWLTEEDEYSDIIISSRIRLARNLKGFPFPNRFEDEDAIKIRRKVKAACHKCPSLENARYYDIDKLAEWDRKYFVERRLASPQLIDNGLRPMLVIGANESLSIMVNEEDHLRIQCIEPGLGLSPAWKIISRVDDELEEHLRFSYSHKYGYLTACPTNLGTGLRASIFVHLPALSLQENINKVMNELLTSEIAVRGFYGEASESVGNIFQISNQLTLGRTEESVLERMVKIAVRIVQLEREAREELYSKQRIKLEDTVFRALGILKHARVISSLEAMNHLSNLRLGCELGLVKSLTRLAVNQLMVLVQPAHLQKIYGELLDAEERDVVRANFIRENLEDAI